VTATLPVTGDADADQLLVDNPLALLLGMLLDQQVPMEWAFSAPRHLEQRIGKLDANAIAAMTPEAVEEAFRQKPALHRYPGSMAKRTHALATHLTDGYDGDAARIWTTAGDTAELLARLKALPGFGDQKARIFAALLGKQLEVRPEGWREAIGPYAEEGSYRSVADVVDAESLAKVRAFKKDHKAAAKAAPKAGA
jgi:uncharacterized HhH-GPD family protein